MTYTTVCIDSEGRVYDLSEEYPSKDVFIINAFTIPRDRLKEFLPKEKKKNANQRHSGRSTDR